MTQDVYKIIGDRIKKIRKARHMTQENLAERAEIDRSHMGFIEQGRRHPTITTLRKITQALNITLEDLFRGL